MQSTIELQAPYSNGLLPIIILGLFLLISLFIFLRNKKKEKKAIKAEAEKFKPQIKHVTPSIKDKYIEALEKLEEEYKEGELPIKDCYQSLSLFIREFITESSGIDVTNKTLADIKAMKLYQLEELMEEYYEPEFSEESEGNVIRSIEKTIGVIDKWS